MDRESVIMFKVGDMYVDKLTSINVSLTKFKGSAIKLVEEHYDNKEVLIKTILDSVNLISSYGLDVDIVRHVVETREYMENVNVAVFGTKLKLIAERYEEGV